MEYKDIIDKCFVLIGVIVGAALTFSREFWFDRRKKKKEAEYLTIRIISMLERFIAQCVAVIFDNGLYHGQPPNENGYRSAQTPDPEFKPESIDVEWKSLPANLMFEILSLPIDIEESERKICSSESVASPPDFEEVFEERQYQYAELGLKALFLSKKLRKSMGISAKVYGELNPEVIFKEKKSKINKDRKKRNETLPKILSELN